jgi:calcineurin-like phosphoesterase family protein
MFDKKLSGFLFFLKGVMDIFFTSDLHFDHDAVRSHAKRPYGSLEEMNEALIQNWNAKVKGSAQVYVLGDFAWRRPAFFADRLMGTISLIRGNHDSDTITKLSKIFDTVAEMRRIEIDNKIITLCHYSMRTWYKSHHNSWHLFGHSHGRLQPHGKSFDVGVDTELANYSPIHFDEVVAYMNTLPDNHGCLPDFKSKRTTDLDARLTTCDNCNAAGTIDDPCVCRDSRRLLDVDFIGEYLNDL